jgi:hypothetical protein
LEPLFGCCRGAAEFKTTFPPFAKLAAHVIDDADLMISYGLSAADQLDGIWILRRCRLGNPPRMQGNAARQLAQGPTLFPFLNPPRPAPIAFAV